MISTRPHLRPLAHRVRVWYVGRGSRLDTSHTPNSNSNLNLGRPSSSSPRVRLQQPSPSAHPPSTSHIPRTTYRVPSIHPSVRHTLPSPVSQEGTRAPTHSTAYRYPRRFAPGETPRLPVLDRSGFAGPDGDVPVIAFKVRVVHGQQVSGRTQNLDVRPEPEPPVIVPRRSSSQIEACAACNAHAHAHARETSPSVPQAPSSRGGALLLLALAEPSLPLWRHICLRDDCTAIRAHWHGLPRASSSSSSSRMRWKLDTESTYAP